MVWERKGCPKVIKHGESKDGGDVWRERLVSQVRHGFDSSAAISVWATLGKSLGLPNLSFYQ